MDTVLITGGTGLLGQRLCTLLETRGYAVRILSRSRTGRERNVSYHRWSVKDGELDPDVLDSDHIIHLAGAGVADERWTDARKRIIHDSRVHSAALLERSLKAAGARPRSIVCASAVGYYGSRGDTVLQEDSGAGTGFLPEVCLDWEASSASLAAATGAPTAILRIGIVLSTEGGALPKLSMPLKLGIGAYLGDGSQYYPWIHIDDLCRMMIFAMESGLDGVYNACAPNPVTNKELCRSISRALNRPFIPAPAPAFILKMFMGEMAGMLLNSQRTSAEKIIASGFRFDHPELKTALDDVFRRKV